MKKLISLLLLLVVVASLLGSVAGCASPTPEPEEGPKVIKIGLVMALTGSSAAWGWSNYAAANLHAKQINEAQDEYEIVIIDEDDASNCDQSVSGAMKLITEDEVVALLGTVNSQCTLLVIPLTQQHEVPHFSTCTGTALTQQGSDYFFRTNATNIWATEQLCEYVVDDKGMTKVAILYSNDEYGLSGAEGLAAALGRRGLEPVAYETFNLNDKDFTGQLTIVRDSGAEAVYVLGNYVVSALMAKQMQELGMDVPILGTSGYGYPEYAELGGDATNGTIFVEVFYPLEDDPKAWEFRTAFYREYNREPNTNAAMTYDSIGIIYEAIKQAGKVDRQVVRDYAASLTAESPYKGATGDVYFDETGELSFSLAKLMWQDGKVVLLKR